MSVDDVDNLNPGGPVSPLVIKPIGGEENVNKKKVVSGDRESMNNSVNSVCLLRINFIFLSP